MSSKIKIVTYENIQLYDELVKGYIDTEQAKSIKSVILSNKTLNFYKTANPTSESVPAFSIDIPTQDVSNLIQKFSSATSGNIVTVSSDGKTISDSGKKPSDFATKSEFNTLSSKVGTVPNNKNLVSMIADATYDDSALSGRVSTAEGQLTTIIGSDTNKSIRAIANEELVAQLIPANASASLDTLTEIADWIQKHPNDASALNTAITALQNLVGTLPSGITSNTVVSYISELVNAESSRAGLAEDGLDTRLQSVESALGSNGSVSTQITNKINALDYADNVSGDYVKSVSETNGIISVQKGSFNFDSKGSASAAQTAAKSYADTLNSAMDSRVLALELGAGNGYEALTESEIRALFTS